MNNRGLSDVIVTLIMILLAVFAVGIVWIVVANVLEEGATDVSSGFGQILVNVDIENAQLDEDGNLEVTLRRGSDGGQEIAGINFIVADDDGNQIIREDANLQELQVSTFTIEASEFEGVTPEEVSIAIIYESGNSERTGDVIDTSQVSEFNEEEQGEIEITQIDFSGFESGSQGWTFDSENENSERSNDESSVDDSNNPGGDFSGYLSDDSSNSNFFQSFDFEGYDFVNISFDYLPESLEDGDYVQLLCDSNEIWRFTEGDHSQGNWVSEEIQIDDSDCDFDSSATLTFEGDPGLSSDQDHLWIDGINITGITNP